MTSDEMVTTYHDQIVRDGWHKVELLERTALAPAEHWDAERMHHLRQRAARTLTPLPEWPGANQTIRANYAARAVQARYRRALDLFAKGDRVMEVGFGFGFFTGHLLRDVGIEAHWGVDIMPHLRDAAQGLMDTLEVSDRTTLELRDLVDVTREEALAFNPDIVVCCEVLEHLRNPAAALSSLASFLPDDGLLLLTVPLLGRLEEVWGHLSVFDSGRVRRLLDEAGLHVQHVEPVYNRWIFLLVSRTSQVSERLAQFYNASAEDSTPRAERGHSDFRSVDLRQADRLDRSKGFAEVSVNQHEDRSISVSATRHRPSPDGEQPTHLGGGFSVPLTHGFFGGRLRIALTNEERPAAIRVEAWRGQKLVGAWRWTPTASDLRPLRNYVLWPDREDQHFLRLIRSGDPSTAERLEVVVEAPAGGIGRATFSCVDALI